MKVRDPYDAAADAETFDLDGYLAQFDPALLANPEGRRVLTRVDPLLFAVVYLRHHLSSPETGGTVTLSDLHLDLCRQARGWIRPVEVPGGSRDAFIAPRGSGKSSWLFLALPMWAAAHGHVKFVAAFADSATQAQLHLQTFKHELDNNALLRNDFPELCQPARRPRGTTEADRSEMFYARSKFAFIARGIDSSSLGMKVGERRPDLILCDDIEPDESSYSAYQMEKRLTTVLDAVLPLNLYARIVVVGTTTMPGSIIHALVRHATGEATEEWIRDEGFRAHHYRAIVKRRDGSERSMWPAKWSFEYLQGIRHTRNFAKNFDCDPMAADGEYWNADDITCGTSATLTRTCLWVDPAVTSRKTSDQTGLAVVSYSPTERRCVVRHAEGVRLGPAELRRHIARLLVRFPQVRVVLVEANQGADLWTSVLHDLPVGVVTRHTKDPKEVRAARVLDHYQQGRVLHEKRFFEAEAQMIAFPKVPHDDIVDAVMGGVEEFLSKPAKKRRRTRVRSGSYV